MDRGAWRATVHGTAKSCCKESGTTKRLSTPLGLYLQLKTVLSALLSHTTSPPVPRGSCKLPDSPSCSSRSSRDPVVALDLHVSARQLEAAWRLHSAVRKRVAFLSLPQPHGTPMGPPSLQTRARPF